MDQAEIAHREETGLSWSQVGCSGEEPLSRNTIFVGSSRLPKKLDSIPGFFSGMLKLAVQLDSDRDVLITAEGTSCDKFVSRIGHLFGIPVVRMIILNGGGRKGNDASPPEVGPNEVVVVDKENRGVDSVLANMADQVIVLSMRKNGNLHGAVLKRLKAGKTTRILLEPNLTRKTLSDELLSLGATGWYLLRDDVDDSSSTTKQSEILRAKDIDSDQFLLHWTRRRVGPWPDQTESDFLDDLIFEVPKKDHREIAALRRILATNRILASNGLTRDPRPVVCFSDISFEQLLERRIFRRHLSRWDFEPYGVAIRKSWLSSKGAVPVRYGDESLWESMTETERPFFQLNCPDSSVDWSVENEWRTVGDVDLRHVPVDEAMVFVPTMADAIEISEFSRWPVVVLDENCSC